MAKLTDRTVKTAKPGRHMDGTVRGLTLLVWKTGARSWVLRYQLNGKRRDMGLGGYPDVSLAKAREKAREAREKIKADGRDPVAERRREEARTFRSVAEEMIASKKSGWHNAKHRQQWVNTLATYAYPKIGIST
jgi:hypothetical protein